MRGEGSSETEIKLRLESVDAGRATLEAAGFALRVPRSFESNVIYDTPDRALRRAGIVLRLREYRDTSILTLKGPASSERYKSREEIETQVEGRGAMAAILGRLGYAPVFRYEKYRAEYARDGRGAAVLDETPIGVFLELEGEPDWIDESAALLGFSIADYITASYGRLFLEQRGLAEHVSGDMVFDGSRKLS